MSKATIASNYIEQQKDEHGAKGFPTYRRVLLTGAERDMSIGQAIGRRLISEGMDVRLPSKAEMDIREGFNHEISRGDTLICCHGLTHLDWIEDQDNDRIQEVIDVNLTGTIKLVSDWVDATILDPHKKYIVLTGSMAAFNVLNASAPYCAAKAGLAHFVKCIAWELAPKGYTVFGIHPSNTEGAPMTEDTIQGLMRYRGIQRWEAEAYWGAVLPKTKWLQPEDIAETVAWLISGKADYLSGANIPLAGGQR